MVIIKGSKIKGNADEQLSYAVDVTQGLTIVLMELKDHLEHGIALNGIYDKFPDVEHI